MKKTIFLTWERYNRRPELLAQHLKAKIYFISFGQKGNLFQLPVRYFVQSWRSWRVLRQEKPDVVFVQNPPIVCVLLVLFYAWRYGSQYVIDSHTGVFNSWKWRWALGLHRALSKRALTTLVHNKSQEKIVKDWGCNYMVLSFPPGEYPTGEEYPLRGNTNVAVIGSLLEDEPLDVVFEAASQLSNVNFYITGDSKRINKRVLASKPANCHMTGFVSYEKYIGLLRGVDVIMTLITRDHTLLMGGFEAISLEKPLIVSDWPTLRDFFSLGTIFVPNTAEGISSGVSRALHKRIALHQEMSLLHERLKEEWEYQLAELQELINRDVS